MKPFEHARSHGAAILEAYPVDPDSPSYRFMGFVPVFEEAGFHKVGRAGIRRHVMQLRVKSEGRLIQTDHGADSRRVSSR